MKGSDYVHNKFSPYQLTVNNKNNNNNNNNQHN